MKQNCTCSAYPFPHRPGGGRCETPKVVEYLYEEHYELWKLEEVAEYSHYMNSGFEFEALIFAIGQDREER